MSDTTEFVDQAEWSVAIPPGLVPIPSGIRPVDERLGGLRKGGSYLFIGAPGPAKMVAALQFLHAGVARGEPGLLVTNSDDQGMLAVARAWGFDFEQAWRDQTLQILGFKDDFELRAIRSIEPDEVLEELDLVAGRDLSRIAVDPGSMFLASGARSLLGASFLKWARSHPATVCSTFSVDGDATSLPSSADWLLHAATGRLIIGRTSEEHYEITLATDIPDPANRAQAISVQLRPGAGLVTPEGGPARRGRDRPGVDENRLLLISLGGSHAGDIETWARGSFSAEVVSEPFEAVARVQADPSFGGVVIHAPRTRVREAIQACRALRPLTRAAIVFTSDDAVRSTDRIHVLEAGADDCLSGGVDFREIDLRIRHAIAAGVNPPSELVDGGQGDGSDRGAPRGGPNGARVSKDRFLQELTRRAANPLLTFFCVLDVTSGALNREALEEALANEVRADEGDVVAGDSDRCFVLLQGAREGQMGPFLTRLRTRLDAAAGPGGDPDLAIAVLSHPRDSNRIKAMLGSPLVQGG